MLHRILPGGRPAAGSAADQRVRAEGAIRSIYLYPMALSFIVTGAAWRWILNPDLGIERLLHDWGLHQRQVRLADRPEMAIYTVVIAAVWQSSGFVMSLFLAGLRGIDDSIIKAAQVEGASMPTIYRRIILPSLRPVFFSSFMILAHIAIKSFDLVMALTNGGPGFATDLPATFMDTFAFTRNSIGLGAASAMMMLMVVVAVIVPFMYSELRSSVVADHSDTSPMKTFAPRAADRLWPAVRGLPLPAAAVRDDLDVPQGARRDPLGQPARAARRAHLRALAQGLGTACTGLSCDGLSGYFWNSMSFTVPAVLISTMIGAVNGYVLTMWRFRAAATCCSAC